MLQMTVDFTSDDLKRLISRKLELLRQQSGQTIEASAMELNMDRSEFFRILKGQRLPMLTSMVRISKKYGVSLDWWFEDTDKIPKRQNKAMYAPQEYQMLKTFKKLNDRAQKTALDTLKVLARNLK
jgi:transcriptional regulator with XRE-family HTH domain